MTEPTYAATIADTGFDPASVSIDNRSERLVAHKKWEHDTLAKVAAADLSKPVRRPRKKAS